MPEEVCEGVRRLVIERILVEIPDSNPPRFVDTYPKSGCIVFVCEDDRSRDWLVRTAAEFVVDEKGVKVVAAKDILKL